MARGVLFIVGIGSIGSAAMSLFAGSFLPEWTGLSGTQYGELYIESLSINVGLWGALGVFALFGATFQRLRLAATLAFIVCAGGIAAGRILGLVQGADYGVYTIVALGLEVAIVIATSAAYISEKARLSREAKELKRAEKAALEKALAAEHEQAAVATSEVTIPSAAD